MDIKKFITPFFMVAALISCSTGRQNLNPEIKGESMIVNNGTTYTVNGEEKKLPFWGSLFNTVCKESKQENVCISPLSAQLTLSMTANGATGETQQQMYGTMGLADDVNAKAKETIEQLSANRYGCEVNIANSIWVNEKLDVKQEFIDTNKEYFNALVTTAPFNKETLQRINEWCSENTKGKIKSALDEIKKNDRMYLINALYFKGGWKDEFNKGKTKEAPFTKEDGTVVEVPMMNQSIKTQYYEDDILQIVVKLFDDTYQMLLVLPAEGVTTEEAAAHLSANYDKILGEMSIYQVTLSMPRFQSDFATSLKNPLKKMGMPRAFGPDAQFDGISREPLYIDDAFQKTFIKVDETGAEAAALTVMRVGYLASNQKPEKRTVKLDRPFIYLITNYQPENVLFIGKVGNPNE
ncbi:MAG: serpin family protein [Bacteroidaceae bacterium]|nr:serpin family protein [Bacteroidaceae bacterium]